MQEYKTSHLSTSPYHVTSPSGAWRLVQTYPSRRVMLKTPNVRLEVMAFKWHSSDI